MRVAFVGMGRDRITIPSGYLYNFVRYHLELPYYYAQHPEMDVILTFPGHLHYNPVHESELDEFDRRDDCVRLGLVTESEFSRLKEFDVIVHWRKWHEHLYRPEARNVILSQDHSYGQQWLFDVSKADVNGKLHGILVFPGWHRQNTCDELTKAYGPSPAVRLIEGLTLGVDTSIYYPSDDRDPYKLLWAADPGRGLERFIHVFLSLRSIDSRYQAHVTWPDYVDSQAMFAKYQTFFSTPGVTCYGQIPNDVKLWSLFRSCGILPYASSFKEPSSRCHRQAMACGALVLYPPNMGTPSELIENMKTGLVAPLPMWARLIHQHVSSGNWKRIGDEAAAYASSESWPVQAERFYQHFKG